LWVEYQKHKTTPEAQQAIKDVEELGLNSFHPWYPFDREESERYWENWTEHTRLQFPAIIPPRVSLPYGKPLTLILDSKSLLNKHGKRPGTDMFLLAISEYYEIILFAANGDDFTEIDEHGQLVSYQMCPDLNYQYPRFPMYYKNPYSLNRPLDSTILIENTAEEAMLFPNNTLVVPVWNGYEDETTLQGLNELLISIAYDSVVTKKRVDHIVPTYHSIFFDAVHQYFSTMARTTVKNTIVEGDELRNTLKQLFREIMEGKNEYIESPNLVRKPLLLVEEDDKS